MRLLLDMAQQTHREYMLRLACYLRLNLLFVHCYNLLTMFQETNAEDIMKSDNKYNNIINKVINKITHFT